jgi:hypothetical protein
LLISALRAANEAPDVRGEAVERARRRLESGQIGADPIRLADAILEDLVVTSELTGGCLVGLLHVRDTVILEYLASLDTAAFDVASQVNALKRLGIRPVW